MAEFRPKAGSAFDWLPLLRCWLLRCCSFAADLPPCFFADGRVPERTGNVPYRNFSVLDAGSPASAYSDELLLLL